MEYLIPLVVIGSIIWMVSDINEHGPVGGHSTAMWVIRAILLWIVVFPVFLVQRSKRGTQHAAAFAPGAVPAAPTTTPAGWYADPNVPGQQRYWDGTTWTEHVHQPSPAPTLPPPPS